MMLIAKYDVTCGTDKKKKKKKTVEKAAYV